MQIAIHLDFKDDEQAKAFADACQDFIDTHGEFSTSQIIIHSVLDANLYRRQRDDLRKDYAMLHQAFNQNVQRLRKAEKELYILKSSNPQKRNSWAS